MTAQGERRRDGHGEVRHRGIARREGAGDQVGEVDIDLTLLERSSSSDDLW